jgi:tetratricopeptide (TPR) repeat protein
MADRLNHHQAMEHILSLHQAGRLPEADAICRRILAENPNNPDALHVLGVIASQRGQLPEAQTLFMRAIALAPRSADYHNNFAVVLEKLGKFDEAERAYRTAVSLRPQDPEIHKNLANVLRRQGKLDLAIAELQNALRLKPDHFTCWFNLASIQQARGDIDAAIASYETAIRLQPDSFLSFINLGHLYKQKENLQRAGQAFATAARLRPDSADAHNNVAAIAHFTGRMDDALAGYRKAIELQPEFAAAYCNLGVALADLGRNEEAAAAYERTLELKPDFASAHWNYGLVLLVMGNFERGWAEYEWRSKVQELNLNFEVPRPLWNGEPLHGRRILLRGEQGFGDAIQFIRYAPLVADRGGHVIIACDPLLYPLFRSIPGIHEYVFEGDPIPKFDVHCPFLTLPTAFKTTLETIPASLPYIKPDPELAAKWKARVPADRLKVGLAWAGRPSHRLDRYRTMNFQELAPILKVPGVWFASLQKGKAAQQLENLPAGVEITDLSGDLTDFSQTAALIANLDLILTVDTAAAHLAGAMGKPVWVLLQYAPDWRWMLHRTDTPWYPTMRLFRQKQFADWTGAIADAAEALGALARNKPAEGGHG